MQTFLTRCQKIEMMAQTIYLRFADTPGYAGEVRAAFRKLGGDEAAHARQFDQLLGTELTAGDISPALSNDRLTTLLISAETLLKEVRTRNLTEEGALRRALQMEQAFLAVHVNQVLHFQNRRLAEFFAHLGQEDQAHIDYLKQLLTWWHAQRQPKPAALSASEPDRAGG